jgi:hypothetical protein
MDSLAVEAYGWGWQDLRMEQPADGEDWYSVKVNLTSHVIASEAKQSPTRISEST